jgi:signal transduction histidine kinase
MLGNLKLVLLQHKKFLAIFFFIVFLPSIILAIFGIRSIQNERYKLQQQNLDLQKRFVKDFQAEILIFIERNVSILREFSTSRAFIDLDYRAFGNLISQRLQEKSLLGHIVVFQAENSLWLPCLQPSPPGTKALVIPPEWKKLQPELKRAERAEFQRKDYADAIVRYDQILRRAKDNQVKAWIQSRIARCDLKQKDFKQAMMAYGTILSDFTGLFTESGRPLGLVSRLEMLDALISQNDLEVFFRESLGTYEQLEQNIWSLDGDQIKFYAAMLKNVIDEVLAENSSDDTPDNYSASIENLQDLIEKKLEIWHMAEAVRVNILPEIGDKIRSLGGNSTHILKNAVVVDEKDVLVLLLPIKKEKSENYEEFLGLLIRISDLKEQMDSFVTENSPSGISILHRSTLSDKIIFGTVTSAETSPDFTDFFPENFPPWRVEVYQSEGGTTEFFFYKNIFFWIILALLLILFLGSALIIRTIVQEVNLLNLKSDFIASVSHEFKTPLTAMGAILERLMGDEVSDPKKAKEYYQILSHDSERLKRLVKNVLDFTKIEEDKKEYRLESTDIGNLVQREVDSFKKEHELDGISVGIKIDDDIPLVFTDEEAMSQALHNILDNAAKFSSGEKNIHVEASHEENLVKITIRDKGVGIPENEQKKIFEKFYRGKHASSVAPTGTGLGLTLAKHIMEAHGGDVVIQSRPGKGSSVSLILPVGKGG